RLGDPGGQGIGGAIINRPTRRRRNRTSSRAEKHRQRHEGRGMPDGPSPLLSGGHPPALAHLFEVPAIA
ncbi:MAG: hypothetical protein ACTHLH_07265, partial [Solirubrobacterales bacterium]